jgi:hypothetical protein
MMAGILRFDTIALIEFRRSAASQNAAALGRLKPLGCLALVVEGMKLNTHLTERSLTLEQML